jgi:hypothetical protein
MKQESLSVTDDNINWYILLKEQFRNMYLKVKLMFTLVTLIYI